MGRREKRTLSRRYRPRLLNARAPSVRIVHSIADLRTRCWRLSGPSISCRRWAICTPATCRWSATHGGGRVTLVTSIFVNRLQFGPQDDFSRLSRAPSTRIAVLLANAGCDVVFAPSDEQIYPQPQEYQDSRRHRRWPIPRGRLRGPGFFVGVCTVVMKLFHMVQPDAAFFGKKDYQQLLIVRRMVAQMALATEIVGCGNGSRCERTGPVLAQRLPESCAADRGCGTRAHPARGGERCTRRRDCLARSGAPRARVAALAPLAAGLRGDTPQRRSGHADAGRCADSDRRRQVRRDATDRQLRSFFLQASPRRAAGRR